MKGLIIGLIVGVMFALFMQSLSLFVNIALIVVCSLFGHIFYGSHIVSFLHELISNNLKD